MPYKMQAPLKSILTAILLVAALNLFAQKVVFVIADGIPADVIEKLETPNIKAIAAKGAYMRAHVGGDKGTYSETLTISAVGYNSLLTGTWVNKHNVWDNDIKAPNYNYPTIFRLLKNQYPDKKIACYSSWLDNRTKLIGDGLTQTNNIHVDYHADGFELDTVKFPHHSEEYMHHIDEAVVDNATAGIKNEAPDLSWVYLEYTDDMGHAHGDSRQMYDAVQMMDAQVGRLWQAITYRQQKFNEKWLIVITTDHGRDEKAGHNHGGQTPRQRTTWMVTNAVINDYANYNQPGIVDILPTIARFMHITIPADVNRELDGIPFTGPVSVAKPELNFIQGHLDVTWQNINPDGEVKIWLATTNNAKTGGKDDYKLVATVPATARHASIDVTNLQSDIYKVVLEGKFNTVNRWWVTAGAK